MNHADKERYTVRTDKLRKQIVALRQEGKSNGETARTLKISESYSSRIWRSYLQEGTNGIKPGVRGRRKGTGRTLTAQQELAVQRLLLSRSPNRTRNRKWRGYYLWTREMVRSEIDIRFRLKLSARTMSEYFERWGITTENAPLESFKRKNSEAFRNWKDTEYKDIQERATKENGAIYWGFDAKLKFVRREKPSRPPAQTNQPEVQKNRKIFVNMIAALPSKGSMEFMISEKEHIDPYLLGKFLSRLSKNKSKVFLVIKKLRLFDSKPIKRLLEQEKEKIEVIFFPKSL